METVPGKAGRGGFGPARRRLFVAAVPEPGSELLLRGPERRYLSRVLRMGPGERVLLFDGSGWEFPAELLEEDRRTLRLRVLGRQRGERDPVLEIRLGVGLLKAQKMELVIQKSAELGVHAVIPLATSRAVPDLDARRAGQRQARWEKIAREASRQCGRCRVAEVTPVLPVAEALARETPGADLSVLFTAGSDRGLEDLAVPEGSPRRILAIVGPEGGFTPEEEALAEARGFSPVGVGPRVLRAETAAILAVGLLQYRFGDMGGPAG